MSFLTGLSQRQWVFIGIIGLLLVVVFLLFAGLIPGLSKSKPSKIKLNMVGIDDRRVWSPIIRLYQEKFPNVKIIYRQLNPNNYEEELLNQLAVNPPDIFMVHHSWLPKHYDKMMPAKQSQFDAGHFQSLYPTIAVQDFAPDGVVFALPLYIDTLVLYYNKQIFDEKGIALPPKTWIEFQNIAKALPFPSAAMGGSLSNIGAAIDIINLLFLQSGTPMVNKQFTRANFASSGQSAFDFYMKFSNPQSEFYSWNSQQQPAEQLFAQGKLPMLFQYHSFQKQLMQINPFLDFGIAPVPQLSGGRPFTVFADYYGLAVSVKSSNSDAAWDFIKFVAANEEIASLYAQAVNQSPILRSIIKDKQALIARSWPQIDSSKIRDIFNQMIESVLTGRFNTREALRVAEQEVTALMRRQ